MELADTSAWSWTRVRGGEIRREFDEAVVAGNVATCDMVRLELLHSAPSASKFRALHRDLGVLSERPIGKEQWERALDVYEQLARQGGLRHRAVKHPDLLIAAAETAGMAVLHYDEDDDRIAAITGQSVRWIAPRGSLT